MSQQFILQVSELTKKVKFLLENELNTVWLTGEISNFVAASSGHWYLSLKDSKAQVRCAMFKGNNQRVRIRPQNGQQVLVRARVSLYEPRGDFQLIIDQMDDAGEGLLRQQYEQLKNKLNALGLFAQAHKKPLPKTINTIGVVTSPTGAAINDILSVLERRNPHTRVIIYPAQVQGDEAKHAIANAIAIANERAECDLLIVGRGGGSLEDLWAFNEEIVVNAIYNSTLPVISAVGHEIDTTLADYVADVRAPTPSAAAELASNDLQQTQQQISQLTKRLSMQWQQMSVKQQNTLQHLLHRLKRVHPEQQINTQQQRADELTLRLTKAVTSKIKMTQMPLKHLRQRLNTASPIQYIAGLKEDIQQLETRLARSTQHLLSSQQDRFASLIEQLHMVSPLATIARGYSVARKEQNIIKSIEQVTTGDTLSIEVADGVITSTVKETQSH